MGILRLSIGHNLLVIFSAFQNPRWALHDEWEHIYHINPPSLAVHPFRFLKEIQYLLSAASHRHTKRLNYT